MLLAVDKVDNGYVIRQYSGKSSLNKCIGQWVAKTPEEVLERVKEILKNAEVKDA